MVYRIFTAFLFQIFYFQNGSYAKLNRPLYQAPEALAMGEAVVGFIDDHNALWYNPAGAAAFDGLEFRMLNLDIKASTDIYESIKVAKTLTTPTASSVNQFMSKDISLSVNAQSTLLLPQMGFTAMYDVAAGLTPSNQTFPQIRFGYQKTGGVQGAFGFTAKEGLKKRGRRSKGAQAKGPQNEWRFGIGGKYFFREGGFKTLSSSQIFNVSKDNFLSGLDGKGSSIGGDLGIQRIQRISPETTLSAGVSYLNVGDMTFNSRADPVRASLNAGVAAIWNLGVPVATLAADVHQITTDADFKQKLHLGAKLRLPLVSFYLGLSSLHFTYGASVDVWLLRIAAVSYAEDLGEIYNSMTKRRYAIRTEVKFEF